MGTLIAALGGASRGRAIAGCSVVTSSSHWQDGGVYLRWPHWQEYCSWCLWG